MINHNQFFLSKSRRINHSTKQNSLRAPYGTLPTWVYLLLLQRYTLFIKLTHKREEIQ